MFFVLNCNTLRAHNYLLICTQPVHLFLVCFRDKEMHFKGVQKQNILQSLCDGRSLHSLLASKQVYTLVALWSLFILYFEYFICVWFHGIG